MILRCLSSFSSLRQKKTFSATPSDNIAFHYIPQFQFQIDGLLLKIGGRAEKSFGWFLCQKIWPRMFPKDS